MLNFSKLWDHRLILAIALCVIVGAINTMQAQRPKKSKTAVQPATIELFEGLRSKKLAAKLVQQDEKKGQLFLLNQTRLPVNVAFPQSFVGFHTINAKIRTPQPRVPNNPRVGGSASRAQSIGASISDGFLRAQAVSPSIFRSCNVVLAPTTNVLPSGVTAA